jgi:Flp pilus assembly protein TadB
MNFQDSADREQELKERELAVRLRELELELHAKLNTENIPELEIMDPPKRSKKSGMREFIRWAKIIGCFCVGLLFVYVGALIAIWVAITVLIGTLCYLGYLLFWPSRSRP